MESLNHAMPEYLSTQLLPHEFWVSVQEDELIIDRQLSCLGLFFSCLGNMIHGRGSSLEVFAVFGVTLPIQDSDLSCPLRLTLQVILEVPSECMATPHDSN